MKESLRHDCVRIGFEDKFNFSVSIFRNMELYFINVEIPKESIPQVANLYGELMRDVKECIDNFLSKNKNDVHKNFRNNLIKLRNQKTKTEVANNLGVSVGAYANWEYGNRVPDLDNLVKISEYYNVSLDRLIKSVSM